MLPTSSNSPQLGDRRHASQHVDAGEAGRCDGSTQSPVSRRQRKLDCARAILPSSYIDDGLQLHPTCQVCS